MIAFENRHPQRGPAVHDPLLQSFSSLNGRIGIFGGSFDPLHNGHLEAARQAMIRHNLDAVVFIPARQNPFKKNAPICSDEGRLEMLVESLRHEPRFFVSPVEIRRNGTSYTIDTLRSACSELNPSSSLFLIVGADCLPEFHKWKDYADVLRLSSLIPVGRPESDGQTIVLGPDTPAAVIEAKEGSFVPLHMDISSRSIRKQASEGRIDETVLPAAVCRLIKEKGHYTAA